MEKNCNFFMYFWVFINFRIKRFLYIQVFVNQGFFLYIVFLKVFSLSLFQRFWDQMKFCKMNKKTKLNT